MPDGLALAVGVVAGLAGLTLPRFLRSIDDALALSAVVVAVLLAGTDLAPFAVVVAVGAVLLCERLPLPAAGVVLVGAAALFGLSMRSGAENWLGVLTAVAVVVAVLLVVVAVRAFGHVGAAVLLVPVPFTVYGSVPDTEQSTAVAVALGLVVAGSVLTPGAISARGLYAFAVLTVWATGAGALGRPASMVASLACFGLLLTGWMWWLARRRLRWRSWVAVPLLPIQVMVGVLAARWAGLTADVEVAASRALLLAAGAGLVGIVAVLLSPRKAEPDAQSAPGQGTIPG